MHTCPPPAEALEDWLESYPSVVGHYGHLLLEQKEYPDADLAAKLVPYFESAHSDARVHFGRQMGLDLHPDADEEPDEALQLYPACLPLSARRGLFGEVMAGMLSEHFAFVGEHTWRVPIFLFRYHADVEKYLFDLSRNEERVRQVFGRLGSDFLGLCFDEDGSVVRFIAGEAKWRDALSPSTIDTLMHGNWIRRDGQRVRSGKGIWREINRDTDVPHGIRQLQRLLQERDPDAHAAAILSLDKALALRDPAPLPRTNLILIAGNDVPGRGERNPLVPWEAVPDDYTAAHDLQVVELILKDGGDLIDEIYNAVWAGA